MLSGFPLSLQIGCPFVIGGCLVKFILMEFKAIGAVTWQNQQMSVLPAKTQISLGIRPVWSESLLSIWRILGSLATIERTAKTLPRLIWVFAGHTLILLVLSCRGSFLYVIQTNSVDHEQTLCYQSWKNLKNVTKSPNVSNAMVNLIINTCKILNFYSFCSVRHL